MIEVPDRPTPSALAFDHAAQLDLCHMLEAIADALPDRLDAGACGRAADAIRLVVEQTLAVQPSPIVSALAAGTARYHPGPTLERLLRENAEDTSYAEELVETLCQFAAGRPRLSTDALGYMLRAFFDARRRRVALEREILLGTARE